MGKSFPYVLSNIAKSCGRSHSQQKVYAIKHTLIFAIYKTQKVLFTYRGPCFNLLSNPFFTSASTPTPGIDEFSSLAMKTATIVVFNFGFVSPSLLMISATRATCPKQSVVPRPQSLSPSMLNEKGSKSCM